MAFLLNATVESRRAVLDPRRGGRYIVSGLNIEHVQPYTPPLDPDENLLDPHKPIEDIYVRPNTDATDIQRTGMRAGTAKIDITPDRSVWMDGMIRDHRSEGVHDPIFARVLALANDDDLDDACVFVSIDVCAMERKDADTVRQAVNEKTGIRANRVMLAATHTHSGPATVGYFNPVETEYVEELCARVVQVIADVAANMQDVAVGCASGQEDTVSHYRRLLADDGHVVMNWEPFPVERIVRPLGKVDPEVGVLRVVQTRDPQKTLCILFNHAGHPNVLSGDSYVISGDYTGFAERRLEQEFGCVAMFVNGAEGTMDIDGRRDRDWEGVVRAGTALAGAVGEVAQKIQCDGRASVRGFAANYTIGKRRISDRELAWANKVIQTTGGAVEALADGVGDDYKAKLFKEIHHSAVDNVPIEQICCVVGHTAFISFPGEVFTEIGMEIKSKSPFEHTCFLGIVNGNVGYIPTQKAIAEGGYAVDTRYLADNAEKILLKNSLALLNEAYRQTME